MIVTMIACGSQPPIGASSEEPEGSAVQPSGPIVCYQGITPGQTTKAEVTALLGEPLKTLMDGAYEIMQYPSPLPVIPDSIVLLDQKVVLITMILEDGSMAWSAVRAQYGEPAYKAYSNFQEGSRTAVYPESGLAFVIEESFDAVLLKQCFAPQPLEAYLTLWGKDLPIEDPFSK
jgi:hypothetical protein